MASLIFLAVPLSASAQTQWEMDFESYADTPALLADFAQIPKNNDRIMEATSYNMVLDVDPDNPLSQVARINVNPENEANSSVAGVFVFEGAGWPSTFAIGNDFSVYFDIRQTVLYPIPRNTCQNYDGFAIHLTSPALVMHASYPLDYGGSEDFFFLIESDDLNDACLGGPTPLFPERFVWPMSCGIWEADDNDGWKTNRSWTDGPGTAGTEPVDANTWYRCRLILDSNGATEMTPTFKLWLRDSQTEADANAGTFPAQTFLFDAITQYLDRTGPKWGLMCSFYNNPGITVSDHQIYLDNIVFVQGLDPYVEPTATPTEVPTNTPVATETPTPVPPPPPAGLPGEAWKGY